ncbi:hypothetical protein H8E07_20115 [bacterium]|nr:hypothetical protein [bacterium]
MTTKTQELELHIGIEEFVEHLVATGQKPSTVGTAKRSLALFEEGLGAKKVIAKIMPVHVAGFFKSEAATTQPGKDGPKPRAKASILQIRRIVRGALVWWREQGYSETVPLPKDEQKYLAPRTTSKATAEPAAAPINPVAETTEAPAISEKAKAGLKAQAEALNDTLLGSDDGQQKEEPAPAGERQYVPCHKNHQRRAVELCIAKGCLSKAAAAKCRHWQQWLAEGTV